MLLLPPTVVRGYTCRDDGDTETRLRKSATECTDEAAFVVGSVGWVKNETLVKVVGTAALESGATFTEIETSCEGVVVRGFVRAKYIRAVELSGERAAKKQRV